MVLDVRDEHEREIIDIPKYNKVCDNSLFTQYLYRIM